MFCLKTPKVLLVAWTLLGLLLSTFGVTCPRSGVGLFTKMMIGLKFGYEKKLCNFFILWINFGALIGDFNPLLSIFGEMLLMHSLVGLGGSNFVVCLRFGSGFGGGDIFLLLALFLPFIWIVTTNSLYLLSLILIFSISKYKIEYTKSVGSGMFKWSGRKTVVLTNALETLEKMHQNLAGENVMRRITVCVMCYLMFIIHIHFSIF